MNKSEFLDLMSPRIQLDVDPLRLPDGRTNVLFKVTFGKYRADLNSTFTDSEIDNMTRAEALHQRRILLAPVLQGLLEKLDADIS